MKKLSAILFIGLLLFFYSGQIFASQFSQSYLRLSRSIPNTPLSGTVCASPSSAGSGVEDSITITFPADFSISSNSSNWNTNTNDLPESTVAWPGIGAAADSVSNKSVTFGSGNLTGTSVYCFNFSSPNSTTGSTGSKTGTITTRNSGNAVIDSSEYAVSIISNDRIQVNATVPAEATDYITEITRVIPPLESAIISERFDSTYQIRYGTFLTYPTTITVEASWTKGTIFDQSSPTVELLEYVVGSAGNAYNSSPPVIDTVNKKITWEITAFPGSLDYETVGFKLRTLDYPEPHKVYYSVSARVFFPGGVTGYKTLTNTYRKSVAPPSNITPTPTPSPIPQPPKIERVGVTEITEDQATVFVWSDTDTSKVIIYGTDIHMEDKKTVRFNSLSRGANIRITGLTPSTKYYYKVYVLDKLGKETSSDIFAFTTAAPSNPLTANGTTLVVTSGNTILSSPGDVSNDFYVIPVSSPFQFKFAMLDKISANSVDANLRDKNTLGLFSFGEKAEANTLSTTLIETEEGVYSGSLNTSQNPGNFELYLRIYDKNGNLKEQRLAEIKTINKFTVLSSSNNKPIEGARIFFYIYNPSNKTYQVIPSNLVTNGNPQLTNPKGQLDVVLPEGKYKAEVSDLRHKSKTVEFQIGPGKNQNFPTVTLDRTGLVLLNAFNYYKNVVNEVFVYNTQLYSASLTGSPRFFDLVAMFSLFGVVILTIFAFSKRHRIPVTYIPSYFYYLVDRHDRNEKYIHGVVYDEEQKPVAGANVYLTDKKSEEIISHTKTNKYGEFYFRRALPAGRQGKSEYLIMAMAKNYVNSPVFEYHARRHLKFKINLRKEETGLNLLGKINHYFGHVLGISFEVLLLGSFIFEILFLNSFGVAKTLPFLLISIFNLTLWILHLHNKSHSKVVF